ncbi:MAG: hypothetical protein ACK55Z_32095 [bacterium]
MHPACPLQRWTRRRLGYRPRHATGWGSAAGWSASCPLPSPRAS